MLMVAVDRLDDRIGEEQKPQIVEEGPHRGDDEADDEEDEEEPRL